ncbi:FecR family protein [Novipirellula artificiosorum]|uniref:FecR protein n=1 Tax=Novipirellula artificiosorum TaxID=2528016 RepID=A0A5C6DVF2_9BACT|nr:FecR domain-containing protein [Novipirellula artificiosorum]TWU40588.1 FecR protein [Novipirellula artificiosorum]
MSAEQRDLELVNDYCSGSLTDADFLELEGRLRESSQIRQLLVEYRSLETALPSALPAGTIQPAESSVSVKDGVIRRLRIEVVALAAAIVMLSTGVFFLWPERSVLNSGDSDRIAVVTQSVGAYRETGIALEPGESIEAGHLTLQRGVVRLDFASGATIAVEGPAKIEVVDEMRVVLLRGVVTATIPESAVGFAVATDTAHIVDLGTAFGVSVGDDGTTNVCVFDGEVSVTRKGATASQPALVREGQAVRASKQSPTVDSTDYEVAPFEGAWPVNSGVLQTTGSIRFVSPGPDFHSGNYKDNEHIVVFPERSGVVLKEVIRVDLEDPGEYARSRYREKRTLPVGRRVTSYLLQFDAIPSEQFPNQKRSIRGQITFAQPIVGVITETRLLRESEAIFGNPDVNYPTPRAVEPRPAGDERPGFDSVILAADQRTLILDLNVAPQKLDQLRVLVESE